MTSVKKLIAELQENMESHKDKEFKGLLVMVVDTEAQKAKAKSELLAAVKEEKATDVGVAIVTKSHESVGQYKINLDKDVKNTIFFYKNHKITNTIVNLKGEKEGACTGFCEKVAELVK